MTFFIRFTTNMGLLFLTSLICLTYFSNALCPPHRPVSAHKKCKVNSDCEPANPNMCIMKGKVLGKGHHIVLKDNCTLCDCWGYDELRCDKSRCIAPELFPKVADPTTCISEGKVVEKNDQIVLADNCTVCDCWGHNELVCNYGNCTEPKEFLKYADPTSCILGKKIVKKDAMTYLKDNCTACICLGYNELNCHHDECKNSKESPKTAGPGYCISEGKLVKKGNHIYLNDNCTVCVCWGYNDLSCFKEGCNRPDNFPKYVQGCPTTKPNNAKDHCPQSSSCTPGYKCCTYDQGTFCIFTDPNRCYYKWEPIMRGKKITLPSNNCTVCECQGYDTFKCNNDRCHYRYQLK